MGNGAEHYLLEEGSPGEPEQVGHRRGDRLVGEQRVGLALQAGGDSRKGDARPGELASVADLGRRRPGLGQQVGTEQVGERLGVDPIVLTLAEEIALVARGWAMWAGMPMSESRSANQPQP
jgi:hypothetical protein